MLHYNVNENFNEAGTTLPRQDVHPLLRQTWTFSDHA